MVFASVRVRFLPALFFMRFFASTFSLPRPLLEQAGRRSRLAGVFLALCVEFDYLGMDNYRGPLRASSCPEAASGTTWKCCRALAAVSFLKAVHMRAAT